MSAIRCTARVFGNVAVEMVEKGQEFLMPMTRFALADDRTVEHVEAANSVVVPCR